jgi:hypothetical protein
MGYFQDFRSDTGIFSEFIILHATVGRNSSETRVCRHQLRDIDADNHHTLDSRGSPGSSCRQKEEIITGKYKSSNSM